MAGNINKPATGGVRGRGRPTSLYILVGIVFSIAVIYQAWVVKDLVHGLEVAVPYFSLQPGSTRVDVVRPEAESAGLKSGDVLIAVNGRPFTGTGVLAEEEADAAPGTT